MTFTEHWFGLEAQGFLAALAASVLELDGKIIEVGSWEGRSTVALANAVHPAIVDAVDTWAGCESDDTADLAAERDVHATFLANMAELTGGNVRPHRMGWRDYFADLDEPIRFLFIDAEHTYPEVLDNLNAALPLLVPGGVVCGDDGSHPPVAGALAEVFGEDVTFRGAFWHWRRPT